MTVSMIFSGCIAFIFALVGFVIGLIDSRDFKVSLCLALVTGFVAYIAATILGMRDTSNTRKALNRVRNKLNDRSQLSAKSFCEHFDDNDYGLALSIRNALSKFYDVAEGSIYPDDDLWRDLEFSFFEPWVYKHLAISVIPALNHVNIFMFPETRPDKFKDLLTELKKLKRKLDEQINQERKS
jgi:hypothetical protein